MGSDEGQEEEHWADDDYISSSATKSERTRRIKEYSESTDLAKQIRYGKFQAAKHSVDAEQKFVRSSARFGLSAFGDINTYSLFTELSSLLIAPNGRLGIIVPIGIATDVATKDLFGSFVREERIASLLGFENEAFIFPSVHDAFRFCALTVTGKDRRAQQADMAFFCRYFEQARDPERHFRLNREDLQLLNPNTLTAPVFRTRADAELTKKLYRAYPVLVDDEKSSNPWGAYYMRLVHMADHAEQVCMAAEYDATRDERLYESKLIWHFDHRFGTFEGVAAQDVVDGLARRVTTEEKNKPDFQVQTRYFVDRSLVATLFSKYAEQNHGWLLVWRDITSATNERTCVATMIPRVPASVSAPVLGTNPAFCDALLLANLNSLVFDYVARQKTSGSHLNLTILKQLPVVPPGAYSQADEEFIKARVVELVFTANELRPFAAGMGYAGEPYGWSDDRRGQVRAELDAYYAHIYGLTRDELRYILDPKEILGQDFPSESFRVLKEREIKEYGEFRTQRLVLAAFDELAKTERFAGEQAKRESLIRGNLRPMMNAGS